MKNIIKLILLVFLLTGFMPFLHAQEDGIYFTHDDFVNKKLTPATYNGFDHGPGFVRIDFKIDGKKKAYNVKDMFLFTRGNSIYRSAPRKSGGAELVILNAVAGYYVWHQAVVEQGGARSTYFSKTIDGELQHITNVKELLQLAEGDKAYKSLAACIKTKKVDSFNHPFSSAVDRCVEDDPANINNKEKPKTKE